MVEKGFRRNPRCNRCNELLTDSNWSPSMQQGSDGRTRYTCRPCWNAKQRSYEKTEDRDRINARRRAWEKRNPGNKYGYAIHRKYGLTLADYDRLLVKQGGVCAICKGPPSGKGRYHVDHDHESGLVRGLLCSRCNHMIGHAREDLNILRAGIYYLIDPPA